MDAALLGMCESAQDEDSEGILAQNPPRQALQPGADCLCLCLQELRQRLGQGAGLALLLEDWHKHREQLPSSHQPWGHGYLSHPAWPACLLVYVW